MAFGLNTFGGSKEDKHSGIRDKFGSLPNSHLQWNGHGAMSEESYFIFQVDTTKAGSPSTDFVLPGTISGTYNANVDWGDDTTTSWMTWNQAEATHTYGTPGIYTIKISGTFTEFRFVNAGDRLKFISIDQWGVNKWTSMASAFYGCSNMVANYTDRPDFSLVTDMSGIFINCKLFNGELDGIDTSSVTTLALAFTGCDIFDQDISSWDVSSVTTMQSMVESALVFNNGGSPNINNWVTTSLINLQQTFRRADGFDQPIGNWDVSNVTTIVQIFDGCNIFNQPLNSWNTSSITSMVAAFFDAPLFNQDLSSWDVSSVTDFSSMFDFATAFKQLIGVWDTQAATNCTNMLRSSGFTRTEYDDLLKGWPTVVAGIPTRTGHQVGTVFGIGTVQYSLLDPDVVAGKDYFVTTKLWVITDGGGI